MRRCLWRADVIRAKEPVLPPRARRSQRAEPADSVRSRCPAQPGAGRSASTPRRGAGPGRQRPLRESLSIGEQAAQSGVTRPLRHARPRADDPRAGAGDRDRMSEPLSLGALRPRGCGLLGGRESLRIAPRRFKTLTFDPFSLRRALLRGLSFALRRFETFALDAVGLGRALLRCLRLALCGFETLVLDPFSRGCSKRIQALAKRAPTPGLMRTPFQRPRAPVPLRRIRRARAAPRRAPSRRADVAGAPALRRAAGQPRLARSRGVALRL